MRSYTAVPNEIIECQHRMNESEFRVTLALVRLTHGWQTAECTVSYDTLQKMTGLSRGGVASGVAATNARGFIVKTGRSSWKSLVYPVDQNSLPVRLDGDEDSLPVRLEKSTEKTKNSLLSRPSTIYKEKKENIYIHAREDEITLQEAPPDAGPYPEQDDLRMEMVTALSREVKETAAIGFTEDKFNNAAEGLLVRGVKPKDLKGFSEWWRKNGFYPGKPALATLLTEYDNFANGVTKAAANGHVPPTIDDFLADIPAFEEM